MRMNKAGNSILVDIDTEVTVSETVSIKVEEFVAGLSDEDADSLLTALQERCDARPDYDRLYLAISAGRSQDVMDIARDLLWSQAGRIT